MISRERDHKCILHPSCRKKNGEKDVTSDPSRDPPNVFGFIIALAKWAQIKPRLRPQKAYVSNTMPQFQ